jgi:hypothetical protein
MKIRRLERQRCIAWMAVLAILLLSVVPTISQIVFARAPHAHMHASMTPAEHARHLAHSHDSGDPDECWRTCGYCDFLAHTPALATIAHLPAFAGEIAPAPTDSERPQPRYAKPIRVAQPRGPPRVPA